MAWKFVDFPLDKVHDPRPRPGSAEVYGKQSTSWVASYDKQYVVLMMVTQAGTGSGTSGPAVRKIWESLYGVHGMTVRQRQGRAARARSRRSALPVFAQDGEILPPMRPGPAEGEPSDERRQPSGPRSRAPAVRATGTTTRVKARPPRLGADCSRPRRCSPLGTLLVWSATSARNDLTGGDPNAFVKRHLVNIAIGVVLGVMVAATDHRWVRILAPLVYVASIVGLRAGAGRWARRSTARGRGSCSAGCRSSRPSSPSWPSSSGWPCCVAERTEGSLRAQPREVGTSTSSAMLAIAAAARRADPAAARPRHHAGAARRPSSA